MKITEGKYRCRDGSIVEMRKTDLMPNVLMNGTDGYIHSMIDEEEGHLVFPSFGRYPAEENPKDLMEKIE